MTKQADSIHSTNNHLESVSQTISTITEENERQESTLVNHGERVLVLEEAIKQKEIEVKQLQKQVLVLQNELQAKASNVLLWVLGSIGTIGFILSIIQLFI